MNVLSNENLEKSNASSFSQNYNKAYILILGSIYTYIYLS